MAAEQSELQKTLNPTLHFTKVSHLVPILTVFFWCSTLDHVPDHSSGGTSTASRALYSHRETDVYEVGDQNRTKGHLYLGQAIHLNTFAVISLWGENKLNELRPMLLLRRENEGKSDGIRKMGTWSAH